MNHSFDVDIAISYGVNEAIFIENLKYWILKNKANKRHFYDGRYWTYNSIKAYSELFPYWSQSQVRRIIDNLVKADILLCGNYSQNTYDRTQWYTLKQQMHLTNSANGVDENSKSLIDTNINTDSKKVSPPDGVSITVWQDFQKLRQTMKAPITETAMKGIQREAKKVGYSLEQALTTCVERSWRGFNADWITDKQAPMKSNGVLAGAI